MDLKEILERNKKAHHRLGMITKELYDTLSDGHHTSLRMAQVNEMMNASFEMLKESDVLHSYVDEELKPAEVEERLNRRRLRRKLLLRSLQPRNRPLRRQRPRRTSLKWKSTLKKTSP